jgi:hypothetical protein
MALARRKRQRKLQIRPGKGWRAGRWASHCQDFVFEYWTRKGMMRQEGKKHGERQENEFLDSDFPELQQ